MEKKYFTISLFAFLGGILLLALNLKPTSTPNTTKGQQLEGILPVKTQVEVTPEASSSAHALLFFDHTTFYQGVTQAEKENKRFAAQVKGGIIPHHLLPGFILADFFRRLSFQNPQRIILIGPNHYERGNFKVLTSRIAWDTPFGNVEPDLSRVDQLVENKLAQVDEDVLTREHSIGGTTSFIKYYLPQTKIVPLILSGKMRLSEIETLATKLTTQMDNSTVLVAPVDFSHYLTADQAQEKDKVTWQVLQAFDYQRLLSLNNDYLDSPPSIATLLKVMEKLGTKNSLLLYNTNSGALLNNPSVSTTSYFSIAYY